MHLALFAKAKKGQRVGEASVLYLWSHTAASRIADLQSGAQIIAIIREPASFLRSLHLQLVQGQVETEADFCKALSLEEARRAGEHDRRSTASSSQMLLYGDYVKYVDQLRRYQEHFPPEQMLILIYDDFRSDNWKVMQSVFRFLCIDDLDPIPTTESNPTVAVHSQRLNRMLRAPYTGQGPVFSAAKSVIKNELFFDDAYLPDRLHVERLGDIDVQLRPVTGGAHEVARQMRKTGGELEQVLRSALGV